MQENRVVFESSPMETNEPVATSPPLPRPTVCPECGVAFQSGKASCWLCRWKIGDPVSPRRPERLESRWTFNLNSLFLWTLFFAVLMAAAKVSPELGVAFGVFGFAAAAITARTVVKSTRKNHRPVLATEKIACFLEAFSVLILLSMAAVMALGGFVVAGITLLSPFNADEPAVEIACGFLILVPISIFVFFLVRSIRRNRTPPDTITACGTDDETESKRNSETAG